MSDKPKFSVKEAIALAKKGIKPVEEPIAAQIIREDRDSHD